MNEQRPPSDPSDREIAVLFAGQTNISPEVYGDDDDSFVIQARELVRLFNVEPQKVLYPGSSTHAGVARIFGKDKVTHVDPDPSAMSAMAEGGYQAVTSTIEDYDTAEPFDLIVSFNAGTLEPDEIQRLLSPTGYVIANNWHGSANRMAEYEDFKLLGAVLPSYTDGEIVHGDDAAKGLGVARLGVAPGGKIVEGDDIDENTMGIIDSERSPDGLFLFQRQRLTH